MSRGDERDGVVSVSRTRPRPRFFHAVDDVEVVGRAVAVPLPEQFQ
jgi:hypothetical protein